jgi:putative ABC transport system substrate-binding protein
MSSITRRDSIRLLGGAVAAWPPAARAQSPDPMRHIGVLMGLPASDPVGQSELAALHRGLRKVGWIVGRNVQLEYRWAGADVDRIQTFAKQLVALRPDVILGRSTPAVRALMTETRTIPIVFTVVAEPVASGFAASLARPGGNVTGFTNVEPSIASKWLELLKEMAPPVAQVGLIFNPTTAPYAGPFLQAAEAAAAGLAVESVVMPVHDDAEIKHAIAALARRHSSGLVGITDSFIIEHRKMIIGLADQYRLPAIYPFRLFAADGGLMSYGADIVDMYQGAASYIARVLTGEKPGDLPIQQPTKFELLLNLKAANALGLDIPTKLLAFADEVIE